MIFSTEENFVLENDSVRLEPLTNSHFEHFLYFTKTEPTLWKYSSQQPNTEENLKIYMEIARSAKEKGTAYPFVVFDKRVQQYAGSTRFYDINLNHKIASLGYTWYGSSFHGTGLNKNCKLLLLDFAFNEMKLERVQFEADATNERSINAMKSIGCTVEGIHRSNRTMPEGRRDSIVLSILRDDWVSSLRSQLVSKLGI